MSINASSKLEPIQSFQYQLKHSETTFTKNELEFSLHKKVILPFEPEQVEFLYPIFESRNEKVEYKKFKMETIDTLVQLVKLGAFMSKMLIIVSQYLKYLKIQFDGI